MALHWIIDSKQERIVATAEGVFTAKEVRAYLMAAVGAQVLHFRHCLDLSEAHANISSQEALELGAHIRFQLSQTKGGPLAVVRPLDPSEPLAHMLGILAITLRPMRIFDKREVACRWLASHTSKLPPMYP